MTSATPLSLSHIPAGSPWWVFAAVMLVLALHIGAGSAGIVSGYSALLVRKGGRTHRRAGNIFVPAMLITGAMAAALAAAIPQRGNVLGGIFTVYLVASAWMTVRRKDGSVGRFERAGFAFTLACAIGALLLGLKAAWSPRGVLDGIAPANFYVTGVVAALAAALDLKVILRGGISGRARIARHVWRICTGLFIASGSFFLGQQKVMPIWLQGSPILFVLALAPLVLMIFWLSRLQFTHWFGKNQIGALQRNDATAN
jgi:hypothetical protein